MGKAKPDPRITKRRVTMRNPVIIPGGDVAWLEATDYVLPEHIDTYVADAQQRWQSVEVSDEPDAGPGGYNGQTVEPDGTVREATKD